MAPAQDQAVQTSAQVFTLPIPASLPFTPGQVRPLLGRPPKGVTRLSQARRSRRSKILYADMMQRQIAELELSIAHATGYLDAQCEKLSELIARRDQPPYIPPPWCAANGRSSK